MSIILDLIKMGFPDLLDPNFFGRLYRDHLHIRFDSSYITMQNFKYIFLRSCKKWVFIALFLVKKVPLNCTSAIKSLLHASLNSLSTIVLIAFLHTTHRTELLFVVVFFSFFCSIVEKILYATRAKSVIALDVLSYSSAALGTIFTSRAIIIHFLHLLHK
jgi:hypothetical protein